VGSVGLVLQIFHTTVFRKYALSARNALTSQSVYFALSWDYLADVMVLVTGLLISSRGLFLLDTFVGLMLTTLIAYQMIPIMKEMALILMQSTPASIPTGKLTREVSTIEGVLEVRKEHFWQLGPQSFVASLRVRVRREVEESAVLDKITELCSPVVNYLTVQIEKDNWDLEKK
jgi:zinc transporter 6